MTIYDISEKAGVSIATVSRVLNGSARVSPGTRKKVLEVIEACGYAPNASARGMGLRSLRTIGILCADSSDLFLAKAVYYLEQELKANVYEALLCCTGYHQEMRRSYMDLILSKKVDSIILVGSNFIGSTADENQYIREASAQVPIMLLNAACDDPNVYSILCDDSASMYEAATAMLDAGIRDILYLYNSLSYRQEKARRLCGGDAGSRRKGLRTAGAPLYRRSAADERGHGFCGGRGSAFPGLSRGDRLGGSPGHRRHEVRRAARDPDPPGSLGHRLQQFHAGLLLHAGTDICR